MYRRILLLDNDQKGVKGKYRNIKNNNNCCVVFGQTRGAYGGLHGNYCGIIEYVIINF